MTLESSIALIAIFGYLLIIFEDRLKVDKASLALLTSFFCWGALFAFSDLPDAEKMTAFNEALPQITQVLFYLMGALLIVEVIDVHLGFQYLASKLTFKRTKSAYLLTLLITFFLSSILDNLTTIIISIAFLKSVIPNRKERLFFSASCVFAANAGGAFTPIGDITTTMLWIEGKISAFYIIRQLFFSSIISLAVFGVATYFFKGLYKQKISFSETTLKRKELPEGSLLILTVGLITLLFVPILKTWIDMPPFMTLFFGVAILWIITDKLHRHDILRNKYRVFHSLGRIDFSCILFFLGVLLTVEAIYVVGLFTKLSLFIEESIKNQFIVVYFVGLISSLIDNVPLVSAMIKLYTYPKDHMIWIFTAYAAGVGGSLLSIGSAPGIALMSLEKIDFTWYAKHFFLISFLAYTVGALIACCS